MEKTKIALSQLLNAEYNYPVLIEKKGGDIYLYGGANEYPYLLLNLYKKSAKHAAIINAKTQYIFGSGWGVKWDAPLISRAKAEQFFYNPNGPDTLNELSEKIILDNEIYNGFAVAVTWDRSGNIAYLEHVPFEKIRKSIDEEFYYVADWYDEKMIRATTASGLLEKMPAFNPDKRKGKQLYYHTNYSAGAKIYPLPNYEAAIPYIEADCEIAKFHINNIRNQFWGGQLITFNDGIPTPEEMAEIERQLKSKFAGSGNAGRFILTFTANKEQAPTIQPLTPSDLDKQFDLLNKQIQQEIFIAHNVTSPMLFGVRVEGQLGGRSEMIDAYELFKNTYIAQRVQQIENCFNYLASFNEITSIELKPLTPITQQLTESTLLQIMTPDELRERAGLQKIKKKATDEDVTNAINTLSPLVANKVLEVMTPNEVRALASLGPRSDGAGLSPEISISETPIIASEINEAIKTLSGRQYQNLMRLVRHYTQGKITLEQARVMIGSGFGLKDQQIDVLLGVKEQAFNNDFDDEFLKIVGSSHGIDVEAVDVVFSRNIEGVGAIPSEADEYEYRQIYFESTTSDILKKLDAKIIEYRKRNPDATVKEMSKEFGVTQAKIKERIQYLMDKNKYPIKEAIDESIKKEKPKTDELVFVMYRYDWRSEYKNLSREDGYDKSRKFCQTMMDLAETKLYTRDDINAISALVGYSVWERRGGWLTLPDGRHRPSCRHQWVQQLVIKKDGEIKRIT